MCSELDKVMTASEAAERWHLAPITIRQACTGYANVAARFTHLEARKSAGTWLVSVTGMTRVFGDNDNKYKYKYK